jgi:hypothetical protein
MKSKRSCAYCGSMDACTFDHVVPRALYPPSKDESRVQRITVPTCEQCNRGWANDEAHFRNMLLISGERTSVVSELWEGPTQRSFTKEDGGKRARDLAAQMVPVQTPQGERYMVYPGRDERVLRIVRKVVRGLCHYHDLLSPVPDEQVWADVQKFEISPEFLTQMTSAHVEEDVLQYRFSVIEDPDIDIHSGWLLQFFTRTPFFCIVYRRPQIQS